MINILKKGVLTGIGLGVMTKYKIEEFAKKTASEAKLSEEEGRKFVEDLLNQAKGARSSLEERVSAEVKIAIDKMELATRNDLKTIEEQLQKLQESLNKSSE